VNDKSLIVDDIQSATKSETADMFGAKAAVGQMSVTCVTGTSVLRFVAAQALNALVQTVC
jgi:hypothetical protein